MRGLGAEVIGKVEDLQSYLAAAEPLGHIDPWGIIHEAGDGASVVVKIFLT